MPERRTYRVECFGDGDWWAVRVLDVAGDTHHTQATDLDDVSVMARDLIALVLDVPEGDFDLQAELVDPWPAD